MKTHVWAVAVIIVTLSCSPQREREQQIVFDRKAFFDSAQATGDGYVYVAGTLTGEGVPYKNNTTAIVCYKDRMECISYEVKQIGPNQIGRLDSPLAYPITKWDSQEIVAVGPGDAANCRKVTINIVRNTELVTWVEEPINQASAACRNADTRLLKWTIEDSPFWRPATTHPPGSTISN